VVKIQVPNKAIGDQVLRAARHMAYSATTPEAGTRLPGFVRAEAAKWIGDNLAKFKALVADIWREETPTGRFKPAAQNPRDYPVHAHDGTAKCFNCNRGALDKKQASGYTPGSGARKGWCARCRMWTFYDLKHARNNPATVGEVMNTVSMVMKMTGGDKAQALKLLRGVFDNKSADAKTREIALEAFRDMGGGRRVGKAASNPKKGEMYIADLSDRFGKVYLYQNSTWPRYLAVYTRHDRVITRFVPTEAQVKKILSGKGRISIGEKQITDAHYVTGDQLKSMNPEENPRQKSFGLVHLLTLPYSQVEYFYRQGVVSADDWKSYVRVWRGASPRFSSLGESQTGTGPLTGREKAHIARFQKKRSNPDPDLKHCAWCEAMTDHDSKEHAAIGHVEALARTRKLQVARGGTGVYCPRCKGEGWIYDGRSDRKVKCPDYMCKSGARKNPIRYSGDAKVSVKVRDDGTYHGSITGPGMERWPFDGLRLSPHDERRLAIDSSAAFDRAARGALGFGSYEQEAIYGIAEADEQGDFIVRRRRGGPPVPTGLANPLKKGAYSRARQHPAVRAHGLARQEARHFGGHFGGRRGYAFPGAEEHMPLEPDEVTAPHPDLQDEYYGYPSGGYAEMHGAGANPACKRCKGARQVKLGPRMVPCPGRACRAARNPLTRREAAMEMSTAMIDMEIANDRRAHGKDGTWMAGVAHGRARVVNDFAKERKARSAGLRLAQRAADMGAHDRSFHGLPNPLTPDESRQVMGYASENLRLAAVPTMSREGRLESAATAYEDASLVKEFGPPDGRADATHMQTKAMLARDQVKRTAKVNTLANHKPGCQCIFHSGRMGRNSIRKVGGVTLGISHSGRMGGGVTA
jgi:hypothetical protein